MQCHLKSIIIENRLGIFDTNSWTLKASKAIPPDFPVLDKLLITRNGSHCIGVSREHSLMVWSTSDLHSSEGVCMSLPVLPQSIFYGVSTLYAGTCAGGVLAFGLEDAHNGIHKFKSQFFSQ
jgi:hypothetical protein